MNKYIDCEFKEVVYAKWIKVTNDNSYWYACSRCGHDIPKDTWNQEWFSNWCPNCGSRMYVDEVEEVL